MVQYSQKFEMVSKYVFKSEGGYTNNSNDPGWPYVEKLRKEQKINSGKQRDKKKSNFWQN